MKAGWILPLLLVLLVPAAAATVDGTCDVTIQGVDLRERSHTVPEDAIDVRIGDTVEYVVTVQGAARNFKLIASLGPYEVILDEQNFTAVQAVSVITGNTTFEGLPGGAAGLYEYRGEVTQWDRPACTGSVLIRIIPASPFTPVLLGATAIAAGGLTSLIVLAVRAYQDTKEIVDVVKDYFDEALKLGKSK